MSNTDLRNICAKSIHDIRHEGCFGPPVEKDFLIYDAIVEVVTAYSLMVDA